MEPILHLAAMVENQKAVSVLPLVVGAAAPSENIHEMVSVMPAQHVCFVLSASLGELFELCFGN